MYLNIMEQLECDDGCILIDFLYFPKEDKETIRIEIVDREEVIYFKEDHELYRSIMEISRAIRTAIVKRNQWGVDGFPDNVEFYEDRECALIRALKAVIYA